MRQSRSPIFNRSSSTSPFWFLLSITSVRGFIWWRLVSKFYQVADRDHHLFYDPHCETFKEFQYILLHQLTILWHEELCKDRNKLFCQMRDSLQICHRASTSSPLHCGIKTDKNSSLKTPVWPAGISRLSSITLLSLGLANTSSSLSRLTPLTYKTMNWLNQLRNLTGDL